MQRVILLIILALLAGCNAAQLPTSTPPPPPTSTPYPTSTLYPIYTPIPPVEEAFLEALQHRVNVDDTIPKAGREAVIALIGRQPTYVYPENPGLVLQYTVALPETQEETKKISVLLIGTGVIVAGEYNLPLWGIEVVFLAKAGEPWFATASIPPWGEDELRLKPLHPDYLKRLMEAGVITPTPEPIY